MLNGLSARLLVLTLLFVALVDTVVVVSSVARFRRDWLDERLWNAQIASLAGATPVDGRVDPAAQDEALAAAMVESVTFERPDGRLLELGPAHEGPLGAHYDLRASSRFDLVQDGLNTLFSATKGMVRVTGAARNSPGHVSVVVDEAPLRAGLVAHARHLVLVSLLLSLSAAALLYFSLLRVLVRPLQGLASHVAEFSAAPEDVRRVIAESKRRDEIGTLQRSLRAMEEQIRHALAQKHGLASLGEAVAKVNHDLRNILSTARLVSNRLTQYDDPSVRTISATLMRSIDRAIELCSDTLKFGRPQELRPRVIRFALRPLAEEAGRSVGLSEDPTRCSSTM